MDNIRQVLKYISEMSVEDAETCLAASSVDTNKLQHVVTRMHSQKTATQRLRDETKAQLLAARGLSKYETLLQKFRFQVYEDVKLLQREVAADKHPAMTYSELLTYVKKVHKLKISATELQRVIVQLDSENLTEAHRAKITALVPGKTAHQISTAIRHELGLHLPPNELLQLGFITEDLMSKKREDLVLSEEEQFEKELAEEESQNAESLDDLDIGDLGDSDDADFDADEDELDASEQAHEDAINHLFSEDDDDDR